MQHEWSRRFILLRQLRDRPVEPRYRFIQTMKLMNEFRRRPCILQTGFSRRRGTDKLTGVLGRLKQRWCRFDHPQGLIDSWCKSLSYNGIIRARSNSTPARPCWPAGTLRRYAAARGDENIDYMVTRGRLERRRRRTARAGVDGHGGQPAADLLPGMRRTVQIAPQHLLANALGSIRSRSAGRC
jgi:hypothetical protein